jgi:hypothetical protein
VSLEAQTRGRRHNSNYWAETQILSADIDRANAITVPLPSALFVCAIEHSAIRRGFTTMITFRTGYMLNMSNCQTFSMEMARLSEIRRLDLKLLPHGLKPRRLAVG